MVASLLALASFQKASLVRDLRVGTEHRYRVELIQGDGEEFRYRLRTKVKSPPKDEKDRTLRLDVTLTDYHASLDGHEVSAARAGGGLLPLAATGLPRGFALAGAQGRLWLPLFALYLPDADGSFAIPDLALSDGTTFGGKGTLKDRRVALETILTRGGKPFAALKLDTAFDEEGWPLMSEGTLVDASGTTRFTFKRG